MIIIINQNVEKKTNLKIFKNDVELSKTSTLPNASTVSYVSTSLSPAINLPKINILNFKSNPNIFLKFINSFKNTIDFDGDLPKIEKLLYLNHFCLERPIKRYLN